MRCHSAARGKSPARARAAASVPRKVQHPQPETSQAFTAAITAYCPALARGSGDVDAIQAATRFGFQVYYGDGTRLDVLRAAGAEHASLIAVCIDHKRATMKIVDIVKEHFPQAKLHVRSHDRRHSLELIAKDVDYQVRETFGSAIAFGVAALLGLGATVEEAEEIEADMRTRDAERFERQRAEGLQGGRDLMHTRPVQPEPLTMPRREGRVVMTEDETPAEQDEVSPS